MMTPDDIRQAIHDILTDHDQVIAAIRQANEAMKEANEAMRRAIERHDEAIVGALLANRAALKLLNHLDQ